MATPMTAAEIAELNAAYEQAIAADEDHNTHIVTHAVAIAAGLTVVREDDQSGILYKAASGRLVYGWESGGFDAQID